VGDTEHPILKILILLPSVKERNLDDDVTLTAIKEGGINLPKVY